MQSSTKQNPFDTLERLIRVQFKDKDLLRQAFVHKSYVNEHRASTMLHNERLEFLGDAVLELVTTEFLYAKFPHLPEGQLTTFRSALVKGKHLAEVGRTLHLGDYLHLSRGEEKSGGRKKNYILANTVEALIGAMYLDRGFTTAHRFIDRFILTNLEEILSKGLYVDAKSKLQEFSQEKFSVTPTYQVLTEQGPDHNKIFEVGVFIGEKMVGTGKGSSKQTAQQAAATVALQELL